MTTTTDLAASGATVPAGGGNPLLPYVLGLSGVVPFWALALGRATGWPHGIPPGEIAGMLATYAATILSFLGGIRWGVAVAAPNQRRVATDYVFGVTPQLFGWGALILPDPWRFGALAIGVLALGPIDRNLVARGLVPDWFGRLRMILSLGAGTALFVAAFT
jgi:hypothetical protein